MIGHQDVLLDSSAWTDIFVLEVLHAYSRKMSSSTHQARYWLVHCGFGGGLSCLSKHLHTRMSSYTTTCTVCNDYLLH